MIAKHELTERSRLRFRIIHIVYAMSLIAAGAATFGGSGVVISLAVLLFWAVAFRTDVWNAAVIVVTIIIVTLIWLLLLPAVSTARQAARRMQCSNNLKQIALALHNYNDEYGCFPPAYVADDRGKPLHSWRVLILPYLESQALYKKYNFNEPWNGPNNRKLAGQIPAVYQCPSHHSKDPHTHYVAVVGSETAWPGERPRRISEIIDGTSHTLLVVESGPSGLHWMEPVDWEVEQMLESVSAPFSQQQGHRYADFFYEYYVGRNAANCDGSVHFTYHGDVGEWRSRLTIAGNDHPSDEDLVAVAKGTRPKQPRYGNWFRLGVLLVLILLPLPWFVRRCWRSHQGPTV